MKGPYEILEQIGHSFKLKLPDSMKIHLVFHAEKLQKDPNNPLSGQSNSEPLLLELENSETEYEVQEILAVKLMHGKLKYRVQWKGWDPDPEWYPASSMSNSPIALQSFHNANPIQPGPLKNLQYWFQCATNNIFPESYPDDDRPLK